MPGSNIKLSIVVLAWNHLDETRRCVESIRRSTHTDHELIIVDNGSEPPARDFAERAADVPVLLDTNEGFAAGMNAGLERSKGAVVAFVNNDTVFPEGWDMPLLEVLDRRDAGIVIPAVTAAGNPVTVRQEPGDRVLELMPFGEFPSGVVYVMHTDLVRAIGGWNQDLYPVASAEDLDLCFTVWANDRAIYLDERVLVEHTSQASVRDLPNRKERYRANLMTFVDRWERSDPIPPRLADVPEGVFTRNLGRAATAARWIRRMLEARDEMTRLREHVVSPPPPTRWQRLLRWRSPGEDWGRS